MQLVNHIHVKYIERHQRLREWLKELKKCERRTRKRLREIEEQMKRQQMENEVVYEPILSKFHHSGDGDRQRRIGRHLRKSSIKRITGLLIG